MLTRMHPDSFDWLSWRAGSIADLDIPCRTESILKNKETLKKYAIGYI